MYKKKKRAKLSDVIYKKYSNRLIQGYSIRIKPLDYNMLLLVELDKIEKYSIKFKDELKCLSCGIRKYLWKSEKNTELLYEVISIRNIIIDDLMKNISSDVLWTLNHIYEYVDYLNVNKLVIGIMNQEIYEEIKDSIFIVSSKKIIDKKWEMVLNSNDESKSFIDVFDDIFNNGILKDSSNEFIHSLESSDVLYRMVKETACNEDRFIPWPNKVQNRWNPPGKTYLYLSYGKKDTDYNDDLKVGEYICLLECKLAGEADVCFCKFEAVEKGRILDLSYNDIKFQSIRNNLYGQLIKYEKSIENNVLTQLSLKKISNVKDLKNQIKIIVDNNPIDKLELSKNSVKILLKLICSCIYKKVDDEEDKEKAYKSFQILANYLEYKGITGIIYPCTRTKKLAGKNLVLFNVNAAKPVSGSITQYHFNGTNF